MNQIAFVLSAVLVVVGCKPGYIEDTTRFANRVKSVVNPDELQSWATNLLAARSTGIVTVASAEIPQFIRVIDTNQVPDVEFSVDSVQLWYGGGHGHWGLYIGNTNFVKESTKLHYFVEWKPGVYFWSGP